MRCAAERPDYAAMSWDRTTTERPCPCGKGKIVITDASDDWGRSEHDETLECVECEQKYVYAQVRSRDDRPSRWVVRPSAAEVEQARARHEKAEAAAAAAIARAREQLGDPLVRALAPLRSRKAVWERLREGGVHNWRCSSFAEFNRRVQAHGRDAAIQSLIDERTVEAIRRLIAGA